ncbi:PCM1-like protein [Saccharomyces kudriavzevii IFO 1802]|uniref:Phosphoacetylglucosamine mutase n=1 Tax=Saccharomyces kudriavzevii (strain ATCC MYA-4449 / AS 2.2408 / CBS 8840 / NBRC 1802 / NCYC 2889) TaxID=226230 RepID=J4TSU9_SACK1|nr:PCM1-like protein [Saccharomyces kudriavzevii IFO 1802]
MKIDYEQLRKLYDETCRTKNVQYSYGTAGFRTLAKDLDTVMFTTGILAVLRSLKLQGQYVGVMITASHNPYQDNGVKIVEPDGSMLLASWEPYAMQLANAALFATHFEEFYAELVKLIELEKIDLGASNVAPHIVVGRDSRESSPYLLRCLTSTMASVFHARVLDLGCVTTPQLHYITDLSNRREREGDSALAAATEQDYYSFFIGAFNELFTTYDMEKRLSVPKLFIDTANGIGGPQLKKLLASKDWVVPSDQIEIINDKSDVPKLLNSECGADYVKTNQRLPKGLSPSSFESLYCSFDGDADRVVFYYVDSELKFHLLDGDKISTLFAKFLSKQLEMANLERSLKIGVVQTAYANGSSTAYIKDTLHCPVSCTKTGVKHLHHEAATQYDIGIYFEANGHGTIIFSEKFHQTIESELSKPNGHTLALKTLSCFAKLINQTVGDAMSDMLAVLATLAILKMAPMNWDEEYKDLPNKLVKCIVPDRSIFQTTDQERKLQNPVGLQSKIDSVIAKYPMGRSFVRASGTEDAVRVYAECQDMSKLDQFCNEIVGYVKASV